MVFVPPPHNLEELIYPLLENKTPTFYKELNNSASFAGKLRQFTLSFTDITVGGAWFRDSKCLEIQQALSTFEQQYLLKTNIKCLCGVLCTAGHAFASSTQSMLEVLYYVFLWITWISMNYMNYTIIIASYFRWIMTDLLYLFGKDGVWGTT